jgi:hypothetical protein
VSDTEERHTNTYQAEFETLRAPRGDGESDMLSESGTCGHIRLRQIARTLTDVSASAHVMLAPAANIFRTLPNSLTSEKTTLL